MGGPVSDHVLPRVAAGDSAAARACVERFGGLVWSLARRYAPSGTDAEDVVQEIFVDLWKSAGRFDPTLSSEAGFVAMIARRRLVDLVRRRAARTGELDGAGPVSPRAVERKAEAGLVSRALAKLPEQERRILVMATSEGLSHQEIAEQTGLPLGTVKTNARRALARVREELGEGVTRSSSIEEGS